MSPSSFSATPQSRFSHPLETLQELAQDVLSHAKELGASDCEVDVSEGFGQSVTVRCDEVETIEYNRDKGIGVTIYLGQNKGHASTSDFSSSALRETVEAALNIARFTAADPCAGLPDAALLATRQEGSADLDLYHPWLLTVDAAIDLARRCEQAAFAVSAQVSNSEGATVSIQEGQFISANSLGFMGGYPTSRHYLSCSIIAGQEENMQRDDWYSTSRDAQHIASPEAIGDYAARRALARLDARKIGSAESIGEQAARRALSRLGARKVKTCKVPVLFEAPLAASLFGSFVHAISGGNLYRKTSFLVESLGKQVFSRKIQISERPHLRGGLASSAFDSDGVRTHDREVIVDGVLHSAQTGPTDDWQRGRLPQPDCASGQTRLPRPAQEDGTWPVGHRTARAGSQLRERRLFARGGRLLGRRRRDRACGRRSDHCRQSARHVPQCGRSR